MNYYADFEALEFNAQSAKAQGIFPYYLDANKAKDALCPIYHALCDAKGKLLQTQNVFDEKISFISVMNRLIKRHKKQKELFIWYHNVQYDFRIILHELFYNNFIHIVDSKSMDYIGEYKTLEDSDKAFSLIGEGLAKYIGANVYYNGYVFHIRDTMSMINNGQDKILQEFGFDTKIPVNWSKINLSNLRDNMELIKSRCEYDVESLAKAIEQFKNELKERYKAGGNTAAGLSLDALNYFLQQRIRDKTGEDIDRREIFRNYYPLLDGEEKEISQGCYHGGICTINKKYAGKNLFNLQMVDIHSSYPYAMTNQLPFGYGEGMRDFSDDGFSEYVIYVHFKMHGIPFQRCHSENKARRILGIELKEKIHTRSEFPLEFKGYLCINSVDLATLKNHAEILTLEFCKGVNYQTTDDIKDFIYPIYEQRRQSKPVQKLAIKIILNSLYGKFAQDLSNTIFIHDSLEEKHKIIAIDNNTYYKPLAGAVTAYARQNLINMIYFLGDDFIYGDTDSVYFLNRKVNIKRMRDAGFIHDSELGKWGLDDKYGGFIKQGKFLSKKNYLLLLANGKTKVVCVGLNKKYSKLINFDNFTLDSKVFNVEKMVNVYGGKAMRKTVFKIRERVF